MLKTILLLSISLFANTQHLQTEDESFQKDFDLLGLLMALCFHFLECSQMKPIYDI